jgi:hypothetical protein
MTAAAPPETGRDAPDPFERLIEWGPAIVLALLLAPLAWVAGFALLGRSRLGYGAALIAASVVGFALYYVTLSTAGWEPPSNGLF